MEQKNSINIFSNPEEIDSLINSRLKQFPRKGGKSCSKHVSWSEAEIQIIDSVIWDYMAKQGLSREATAQQIYSRWDISLSTARRYVTDSIKRIANTYSEEEQEEVAGLFNQTIHEVETKLEMEKAVKETIIRVKKNSIDYHSKQLDPTDMNGLMKVVSDKKALEQLENLHISID